METAARARDGPRDRGGRDRVRAVHGSGRPRRGRPGRDRGDAPDDGRGRDRRHDRHRRGRARRGADALHRRAGRPRATGDGESSEVDIAVDPLEGTNLVAHRPGRRDHGARRVREGRPDPRARHVPREARASGPVAAGKRRHHAGPPPRTCSGSPRRCGRKRQRHHGRSSSTGRATTTLIAEVRAAGARIKLITDGDLSAAIACAVPGTGVHAVMGIGGAPEGVITAAALRCLGGEIQARFRFRNDEERARGEADVGHGDEDRVYRTEDLASRRPARVRGDRRDRRATCSRASGSSAAARGRTRS